MLELRFTVNLKRHDLPPPLDLQGPIFLETADGLGKSLTFDILKSRSTLHFWFNTTIASKRVGEAGIYVDEIDIDNDSYVYWDPAKDGNTLLDPIVPMVDAEARFPIKKDMQEGTWKEPTLDDLLRSARPPEYTSVILAGSLEGHLECRINLPEETLEALGGRRRRVPDELRSLCEVVVRNTIHPFASRLSVPVAHALRPLLDPGP